MIDKTTVGVTAEPEEVEAALRNLCGYHLAERDPLFRYTVLTREQVLYDALVAAIKRERGRALAELAETGQKLTQIASVTNLTSRQQVQRLITLARTSDAAAVEVQLASREFEDRLAAVEATLDEVVSGIAPATSISPAPGGPADAGFDPTRDAPPAHASPAQPSAGYASAADAAAGDQESVGSSSGGALPSQLEPDDAVFLEPTQFMPALRGILHPTKEMPSPGDDVPWWRRGREPREGRDSGAA